MKIGLARRGYSSTGGAENYLRRLAVALTAAGHEPTLLADPTWPPDQRPAGVGFVAVPGRSPRAFAQALAPASAAAGCDRLFSLERVWRCDCYRAGDGVHQAWLERRRRAEPWWQHLLRPFNRKHVQLLALERQLFAGGGAARIIANSELVRREIIAHYGTPAGRIRVVYNGLPAESFTPVSDAERAAARADLGLTYQDYAILFAGTGWGRKGFAHVLRAVGQLSDETVPTLLAAGRDDPGPYWSRSTDLARDRTRFVGPTKNMRALYAAADVFVAPTLYDPFSNACLEALAAGLPVLTTGANGFAEIIEPGVHGEIFDVADGATGEALAALLTAWADPDRRAAARPLCAAKARTFTIEKNVAETLAVLLPEG